MKNLALKAVESQMSLIGPGEKSAFDFINPMGNKQVLLLCDHASNRIPRALENLGVEEWVKDRHVAYDIGVEWITRYMSEKLNAPAFLTNYSRLVIDCNREVEDPSSMPVVSDNIDVPGNHDLSVQDKEIRWGDLFWPYHNAIDEWTQSLKQQNIVPAVLSIHSLTERMGDQERPWDIMFIRNRDHRIMGPLIDKLRAQGLNVGDNEPYDGRVLRGYTIEQHAERHGFPHMLVEFRQDLIDTQEKALKWADTLMDALKEILADESLYQAQIPNLVEV